MIKVSEKYVKPLDFLFILRPTLFFPIWIIALAGYSAYFTVNGTVVWWKTIIDWQIFFNLFILTLAAGATFIFNQLQDIETDKDNQKLFLISEKYVRPELAKIIAIALSGISLLVFLIQDIQLFLALLSFLIVWGYLYNYPPFAWKDKAIMGIIANLLGGVFLFLTGWLLAGKYQPLVFLQMIPYLLAWSAVALLTTIPDQKGDAKYDKNTFAVKFGEKLTIWLAASWVIIGFIIGMKNNDPIITHPTMLSIPLFIIMAVTLKKEWVLRSIRFPLLFLAIILCAQFPYFFLVILINYYVAKFYYINRFNLDYPTFRVDEE